MLQRYLLRQGLLFMLFCVMFETEVQKTWRSAWFLIQTGVQEAFERFDLQQVGFLQNKRRSAIKKTGGIFDLNLIQLHKLNHTKNIKKQFSQQLTTWL